jgi:hypothetical protein
LRERLLALIKKDQLLADHLIISLLYIVEADPVRSKLQEFGDQIPNRDMDGCPQFCLFTFWDDFES